MLGMLHVAFTSLHTANVTFCATESKCVLHLYFLRNYLSFCTILTPQLNRASSRRPAYRVSSKIRKPSIVSGITTLAACIFQCQHTNHGSRKCFLRQWGDTASPRERAAETNEYQQRRSKLPHLPVRCPSMTSWVWSRILTFHVLALFLSPVTDIFKNVGLFMRHIPFRTNVCF